jgi:hypothetical protein
VTPTPKVCVSQQPPPRRTTGYAAAIVCGRELQAPWTSGWMSSYPESDVVMYRVPEILTVAKIDPHRKKRLSWSRARRSERPRTGFGRLARTTDACGNSNFINHA